MDNSRSHYIFRHTHTLEFSKHQLELIPVCYLTYTYCYRKDVARNIGYRGQRPPPGITAGRKWSRDLLQTDVQKFSNISHSCGRENAVTNHIFFF